MTNPPRLDIFSFAATTGFLGTRGFLGGATLGDCSSDAAALPDSSDAALAPPAARAAIALLDAPLDFSARAAATLLEVPPDFPARAAASLLEVPPDFPARAAASLLEVPLDFPARAAASLLEVSDFVFSARASSLAFSEDDSDCSSLDSLDSSEAIGCFSSSVILIQSSTHRNHIAWLQKVILSCRYRVIVNPSMVVFNYAYSIVNRNSVSAWKSNSISSPRCSCCAASRCLH